MCKGRLKTHVWNLDKIFVGDVKILESIICKN